MDISLEPGHYVAAVSGGVDSVVMLQVLHGMPGISLTVAHFDHGIRPDSADDACFVQVLAGAYGLPYVTSRVELGPQASEDQARQKRYEFLHAARQAAGARAVLTAHHQDDVLETAVHNIIRGTGRRGLSSLASTSHIKRPLLAISKQDIYDYAGRHNLEWREDSTNGDQTYTRNYIRQRLMPRFSAVDHARLHDILQQTATSNAVIDREIGRLLNGLTDPNGLHRQSFICLPHSICREIMAAWLRRYRIRDIDRDMVERLVWAAKTFRAGKHVHAAQNWVLTVEKSYLALKALER